MKSFRISAFLVILGFLAITIMTVGCDDRSKRGGGVAPPVATSENVCSLTNLDGECDGEGESCINGNCIVIPDPNANQQQEDPPAEEEDPPVDEDDPGEDEDPAEEDPAEEDPPEEEGPALINPALLECLTKEDCLPQPVQVIQGLFDKPAFNPPQKPEFD